MLTRRAMLGQASAAASAAWVMRAVSPRLLPSAAPGRFRCPARRVRLPRARVRRSGRSFPLQKSASTRPASFRRALLDSSATFTSIASWSCSQRLRRRQRLPSTPSPHGRAGPRDCSSTDHSRTALEEMASRGNSWRAAQSRNQYGGTVRSSRRQSRPGRHRRANPRAGLACADLYSHCRVAGLKDHLGGCRFRWWSTISAAAIQDKARINRISRRC